ncbi:MAG: hypothetical protein IPJ13_16640 [Saprospiraceae bacterium]|nr:hypothetical protein [Saprospiraceae bacterium]
MFDTGTPFVAIGNSGPEALILKRSLKYEDSIEYAFECALLLMHPGYFCQ